MNCDTLRTHNMHQINNLALAFKVELARVLSASQSSVFPVPESKLLISTKRLVACKRQKLTVTGSHPEVALKPSVPQPGLLPTVISLNASRNGAEYIVGLMKPIVPFPAARRASLIMARIAPVVGEAAEVPHSRMN